MNCTMQKKSPSVKNTFVLRSTSLKTQKTFLYILVLLFSVFPIFQLQSQQNPAKRYLTAYKKYVDIPFSISQSSIKHFVYFARDRKAIQNHPILTIDHFKGAQIMYPWRELEPEKDRYDFSIIHKDYEYLQSQGKKLFIQLQDATFSPNYVGVPDYLLTDAYEGGSIKQVDTKGNPEGWVAKRWNIKVQERFALLLKALGKRFDGKIEGINLQESSIEIQQGQDPSFSPGSYVKGLKANMLALKTAFPTSITMQYANFIPGEWLPWDDKGYLRSIYKYGEEIGVGLGGPDLMVRKKPNSTTL